MTVRHDSLPSQFQIVSLRLLEPYPVQMRNARKNYKEIDCSIGNWLPTMNADSYTEFNDSNFNAFRQVVRISRINIV